MPTATKISITEKQTNDYGDAKCACCGRDHRKMCRMSDGSVMGATCAQQVSRITDGFGSAQYVRDLRAAKPTSPALRFAAVS